MIQRIDIGGNPFRVRVTREGKATSSTDMRDFVVHENMDVCAPFVSGSVSFAAAGNVLVNLGKVFANPPLILLRRGDNRPVTSDGPLFARMQANMSSMRIYNQVIRTGTAAFVGPVTYFVFARTLG